MRLSPRNGGLPTTTSALGQSALAPWALPVALVAGWQLAAQAGLHGVNDGGITLQGQRRQVQGGDIAVAYERLGVGAQQVAGHDVRADRPGGGSPFQQAAGRALAALHVQGFSHGRPAVRDLCWDGTEVRFIDMEKFSARHDSPRHFAADMLVFVHSVFAAGGGEADLENALTAYRSAGGPWQASIALARRLRWIGPVSRGLLRLKPNLRELMAVEPMALDLLVRLTPLVQ